MERERERLEINIYVMARKERGFCGRERGHTGAGAVRRAEKNLVFFLLWDEVSEDQINQSRASVDL